MPKTRVVELGEVVEHSAGATREQIIDLAKKQKASRAKPKPAAPSPAEPDIVGRTHRALTAEPPMGARTAGSRLLFGPTIGSFDYPGRLVRAAGDLFLPASIPEAAATGATLPIGGNVITAPLKRTAAAALAGGGAALGQGRDWASALTEAGRLGLSQFAGELLPGMLRFGLAQKGGGKLLSDRERKIAHDTAMHEAVTGLESEGYKEAVAAQRAREAARVREARAQYQEQVRDVKAGHEQAQATQTRTHEAATAAAKTEFEAAKRAYAEQGAQTIADAFKERVSAWRDFPSNEQGLLGMVYGEGQAKLSAAYDAVLKEIVIGARGRTVEIPARDASELKIRMWNVGARQAGGAPQAGDVIASRLRGMPDMAMVDASQLAEHVTGFWKKNPGVYRRSVAALDRLDIGDPAARAEYKAGQALIQFTDKTKMLKGEKFNPEAARAGFTELKKVDELRRRGQGDIFTGPVAEAVRRPAPELRLPAEPVPLTEPRIPAFRRPAPLPAVEPPPKRVLLEPPKPEGVASVTIPRLGFWPGAAVAEIPFLVESLISGQPHHGYGLPVAVGGLLSYGAGGRRVITRAPETPLSKFATSVVPPLAQEARRATGGALTIRPGEGLSMSEVERMVRERAGPTP